MPSGDDPREADFEQASSQLNRGLKTCRAVVENYRAILGGEVGVPANDQDGFDGFGPQIASEAVAYRPEDPEVQAI